MAFTAHPAIHRSSLTRWPARAAVSIRRHGPQSPRRTLQLVLAALWLLDAGLQYQPYMFTKDFVAGTLAPAAQGNPSAVATPMNWAFHLLSAQPVVFNALFATVQLLIAAGLVWRRTAKMALSASVMWAVGVWWFGEGLGGILTGASPIMGAPGAVILYALVAVLVWPRADSTSPGDDRPTSVAENGLLGAMGSRLVWVALWGGLAALFVVPANRTPSALHDMVAAAAGGEPGWLAGTDRHLAALLTGHGTVVSIALAVLCDLIALSVFVPRLARAGIAAAAAVAGFIWVAQALGGIFTSQGTDPNTGLLLAVVAATFWVAARPEQPSIVHPPADPTPAGSSLRLLATPLSLPGWNSPPGRRRRKSDRTASAAPTRSARPATNLSTGGGNSRPSRNGRHRLAGVAATVTLAVTGCAAAQANTQSSHSAPGDTMAGMAMSPSISMSPGVSMPAAPPAQAKQVLASGPSQSARMVCGPETAGDISTALALGSPTPGTASWADHLYTCTYHLPAGTLILAVKELPDIAAAHQYFAAAQAKQGPTQPIVGLASLGLPGFETSAGTVMFLKDDKTVQVDAAGLPAQIGSFRVSRSDFAYQIATDVLGCWTEK